MYIIYTYYILCMCVCRAQLGKKCRWPQSAQQSMQQKYENKTTKKMKSNRNIFVWNGLKTKQSESKQKQAHTTKRNVCVMYGKYVHCTHTHTQPHTHSQMYNTYGYVLLWKGTHKYFIQCVLCSIYDVLLCSLARL